jgi:hypothetical protein
MIIQWGFLTGPKVGIVFFKVALPLYLYLVLLFNFIYVSLEQLFFLTILITRQS